MTIERTVYKRDQNGNTRVWFAETDGDKYRFHTGVKDGAIVISDWRTVEQKNVGKANETSLEEQVRLEVESHYRKQLYQGGYHENEADIEKGAHFLEPMLAQKFDEKKTEYPVISQPKLDGARCLGNPIRLQTREGKDFVSVPHIQFQLDELLENYDGYTLDGELYNHDMKEDFEKIMSLIRKSKPKKEDFAESAKMVQYHVYDIITPEPMDYADRHALIEKILGGTVNGDIHLVPYDIAKDYAEVLDLFKKYTGDGYEGQMLRKISGPYEHKRSKALVKHKAVLDDEFVIEDVVEGQGNWSGKAKSLVLRRKDGLPFNDRKDGETCDCGVAGDEAFTAQLLVDREKLIGTDVTVEYFGFTKYGKLRFPVAKFFWYGKRDV